MASVHLCICASVPVHTGQATKQAREAFIIVGASVVMAGDPLYNPYYYYYYFHHLQCNDLVLGFKFANIFFFNSLLFLGRWGWGWGWGSILSFFRQQEKLSMKVGVGVLLCSQTVIPG